MESIELQKKLLNTEYVYCLSNTSFCPNILKVGWTRHNPAYRANQLYTTGIPTPFKIEFLILTNQGKCLESRIHSYLSRCRISGSREFFNISVSDLRDILKNKFGLTLIQISDILEHLPKITRVRKHKKKQLNLCKLNSLNCTTNEQPLINSEELNNIFDKFRYHPSPPSSPRNKVNIFDEFRYRPSTP